MSVAENTAEQQLQQEFNRWAAEGRGEEMERHHLPITAPVLDLMQLRPADRVLDLGCGAGWATRLLAARVPQGKVIGVDISDEMIEHARRSSSNFSNIEFAVGSSEKIPSADDSFDKALSIESFYYYPDQGAALNELRRVLKESDVVLYAIGILGGSDVGSSLGMEGQGILDELASVSGGKAFYPRSAPEMDDIFEQIALELRHQYSIGYRPPNFKNDGKWHHIKVKVAPPRGLPRLFVRSKEGYFAIANPK